MSPNLFIVLLGTCTITSYRPVPAQTKPECVSRDRCRTSIDDGITQYGAAVSQDLLKSGQVHYGDVLDIEGIGLKIVNDTMNPRHRKHVDLLVFSYAEEKKIGVQHRKVWVIRHD
jgi:3D (Asp-Asp-Asp) domain-containing protein